MPELAPGSTAIRLATNRLRRGGVADPRREALRIWSEITGDRWPATLRDDTGTDAGTLTRFERAIERRARGEPLPHVLGTAGFRHLSLRSDGRALIPRPETEGLVDLLLERVQSGVAVDVGTGSGCLALSLALEGSFSAVVAVDRSRDALALAAENVAASMPATPVHLVLGDLCEPLTAGVYDALISNPPYLTAEEYAGVDPSVGDWEPAVALVGGVAGLEITTRLLEQGTEVVRSGGWLAIEVDSSRAAAAAGIAAEHGWQNVSVHEDLFGRARYLLAQRSDTR
jgi:release factor glutamine methyltransferase